MKYYSDDIKIKIRTLRKKGYTYSEIQRALGEVIPKSSLTYICKGIVLSLEQNQRIQQDMKDLLVVNRKKAVAANRKKFETKINDYRLNNRKLTSFMQDRRAKLVALSMLYLGEGAKWQGSRSPRLGSTDPLIIRLYIDLLRECYGIQVEQLRCSVQHRADQNSAELIDYWSGVTGIPKSKFYPSYIDKRTIGHPTRKANYRGVCSVGSSGTHIQLELEQIAVIISKALRGIGAVG